MGTGAVLVLGLGGALAVRGTITLGEFVAFGSYLAMLHWPMIALGWVINLFERGEASMGRIDALLDTVPEIRDEAPARRCRPSRGAVAFRGLTFAYGDTPGAARHRPRGGGGEHGGHRGAHRRRASPRS